MFWFNYSITVFLFLAFIFFPSLVLEESEKYLDNEIILMMENKKKVRYFDYEIMHEKKLERQLQEKNIVKKVFEKVFQKKKNKSEKKNMVYKIDWNFVSDLAETVGYKKREEIEKERLVEVFGRELEVNAANHLREMFQAAKNNGIELNLVSAFRSYEDQRNIFQYKFYKKCRNRKTQNCKKEILKILEVSSAPKYSKHHTGKTVDLACGKSRALVDSFRYTECYKWLSENNFENAKRFNFYPSYPYNSKRTGPLPEPWEFVWEK